MTPPDRPRARRSARGRFGEKAVLLALAAAATISVLVTVGIVVVLVEGPEGRLQVERANDRAARLLALPQPGEADRTALASGPLAPERREAYLAEACAGFTGGRWPCASD